MAVTRREIAAEALGAIVLGIVAAALPTLFSLPVAERPDLRGIAAATLGALATSVVAVRLGWRYGRKEDPGKGGAHIALLRIALVALLVATPSCFAGVRDAELAELVGETQRYAGWPTPTPWWLLGTIALFGLFSGASLAATLREKPPSNQWMFAGATVLAVLPASIAIGTLYRVPAPIGLERTTKAIGLTLVAALTAAAAAGARRQAIKRLDLRSVAMSAGALLAGWGSWIHSIDYLTPSPTDLVEIRSISVQEGWTLVDGELRGRPDLIGTFALAPGASRLRLVSVGRKETYVRPAPELQAVDGRLVYRSSWGVPDLWEGSPTFEQRQAATASIRARSLRLPFVDRDTGLSVPAEFGFAVCPKLDCAIAAGLDREWAAAEEESRRSSCCSSSGGPTPKHEILVVRRGGTERIASGLEVSPRILAVDGERAQFLFSIEGELNLEDSLTNGSEDARSSSVGSNPKGEVKTSSTRLRALQGRRLGVATYLLRERRWEDVRSSSISIGSEFQILPDRNRVLAHCGTMCIVRLDDLDRPVRFADSPSTRNATPRVLPLSSGGVAMLWYERAVGTRDVRDWRLTLFGSWGEGPKTLDLGSRTGFRFAGELEDGSIAIAGIDDPPRVWNGPIFGFRVEAIHPATLARRTMASDLGAPVGGAWGGGRLFMTREGGLIVPTAAGMRDATRAESRFLPLLDSTGRIVS